VRAWARRRGRGRPRGSAGERGIGARELGTARESSPSGRRRRDLAREAPTSSGQEARPSG
jgi:hypothetical protein